MSATTQKRPLQSSRPTEKKAKGADEDEMSVVIKRQMLAAKRMFINACGAPPSGDGSILELKKNIKARAGYNTTIDGSNQSTPRPKPTQNLKMLTDRENPPASVRPELPQPTGEGQLIVSGSKEKAEEVKKSKTKSKDLVVLPMSGSTLRDMHNKGVEKPKWHAPWKLHRVIAGHLGWVRCIAVDHGNEWFASSGADRAIKIWDLASGELKLTLTGHVAGVRGMSVSSRSPYLFTCGEDGKVLCWDLETNKVIRHYHGHLNGVYTVATHPELDILFTGGRDASVRCWDIRTRAEIHTMTGHTATVNTVACPPDPKIISGSHDNQIRIWDIGTGKCESVLTHHKKGVRSLAVHPTQYTFASGAADNVKKWRCPRGDFLMNFSGHKTIVNTVSINTDGVLASAGDDGEIKFWDWKTGYNFNSLQTIPQPGSLESERAIYCSTFDRSGSRLITGEADKSIKIWKEDETATEKTHPIDFKPPRRVHY
eukprot:TRINITY_DN19453_c0_g1_i2.p1 TRINITY_DN19453_c0_g1~~TRINITY_DN19453_c0_g1_i2.p1  ORF type:complete len:483 (+),score=89.41 TRINITY_DN19453_c0_g1_i2:52-1500(+)